MLLININIRDWYNNLGKPDSNPITDSSVLFSAHVSSYDSNLSRG